MAARRLYLELTALISCVCLSFSLGLSILALFTHPFCKVGFHMLVGDGFGALLDS